MNRKTALDQILDAIKSENNSRADANMSSDSDNQCIAEILGHHALRDDEDSLVEAFGQGGLEKIRDAEQGIY